MVFLNINNDTFFFYKKCMELLGTWPRDRYEWRSAISFSISLLLLTMAIILRLIDPYGKCRPYVLGKPEFEIIVFISIGLASQLILKINGSRMIPLIESTTNDWSSILDSHEREIMEKYEKCGTYIWSLKMFYAFSRPIILTMLTVSPSDVAKSSDRYIERPRCVFHEDYTELRVIGALLSTTSVAISAVSLVSGNMFIWSVAMHLSSQGMVLKRRFRKCLLIWDEVGRRKQFRRLVDRHNEVLDLCAKLQHSFAMFIVIQVFGSELTACLSAVQFVGVLKTREYTHLLILILNIMNILSVSFLLCYAGDCITDSCEEIGKTFTQCQWYNLSKDSMSNYSIVIARSQMPTTLTVIKFYNLNLSNFKRILKAIYSYISLLAVVARR